MDKRIIKGHARRARESAQEIIDTFDSLAPVDVEGLGSEIRDSGRTIIAEAGKSEEPWVPEPPPPPEPPPMGGDPELPVLVLNELIEKNGGACVSVKGDNQHYKNLRVRYGEWMGFSVAKQDPDNGVVGFGLDNVQLETGWAGDRKGWGVRGYDMAQFHYRDVNFLCAMPIANNIEHGNYQNIYGGGLLESCFWYGLPGQASQYVWSGRELESANFSGLSGKDIPGDVIHYLNCQMHNCGSWINGRASFVVSVFKGQVGLTLENHLIQKLNEPKTHGAILFQGNGKESLQLLNSRTYYTGTPDREMVQCVGAKDVLVDGGEYRVAPGNEIKGFRFMNCGQVEFTGNVKGNLEVWVGQGGQWQTKTTVEKLGAGTIL